MGSTRHTADVIITQQVVPDYRVPFFLELAQRLEHRLLLLTGRSNVALDRGIGDAVSPVRERHLFGGRLIWQSLGFRRTLAADVVVLTFNPRILSNMVVLALRRVLGRRTLLWGHAWSRSGRGSRSNHFRRLLCRASSGVIAYTDAEAQQLRDAMPWLRVWTAPNALYPRSLIAPAEIVARADQPLAAGPGCPLDVVVCSRLIVEKKPQLALDAFALAAAQVEGLRLVFVGDGPLRGVLERRAAEIGLADRVEFRGTIFAQDDLAAVYARALVSLSPGYVGLSITQSLGFGVPMIYARDENHSPEVTLADEGFNSVAVASDDAESMAAAIIGFHSDQERWRGRRAAISERCRDEYSIEAMADGFVSALTAG